MPSHDRALRRMIVDLATLQADDVEAVLARLDRPQREKIESLLREFSDFGFGERMAPVPAAPKAIDASRLSPWLAGRIVSDVSPSDMTETAHAKLRDCALRLFPAANAPGKIRVKASDRLGSLLAVRKTPA